MAAITITTQPSDMTAAPNGRPVFRVVASGSSLRYQWEYSVDSGATWSNTSFTGNKTANMTVTATLARNGYLYRCKLTSGTTVAYTRGAELICNDENPANQISRITKGKTAIFNALATKSITVPSGTHINALASVVTGIPVGTWYYGDEPLSTFPNARIDLNSAMLGEGLGRIDIGDAQLDVYGLQLSEVGKVDFQIVFLLLDTSTFDVNGIAIGSYGSDGTELASVCCSELTSYPSVTVSTEEFNGGFSIFVSIDESSVEEILHEWLILSISM